MPDHRPRLPCGGARILSHMLCGCGARGPPGGNESDPGTSCREKALPAEWQGMNADAPKVCCKASASSSFESACILQISAALFKAYHGPDYPCGYVTQIMLLHKIILVSEPCIVNFETWIICTNYHASTLHILDSGSAPHPLSYSTGDMGLVTLS